MSSIPALTDSAQQHFSNKSVLLRVDANVPMQHGRVSDDTRLRAILPTIRWLLDANAAVIICSHFGRPTEGLFDEAYSLKPVAAALDTLIDAPVHFVPCIVSPTSTTPIAVKGGEVAVLENIRFSHGEKAVDDVLSQHLASIADSVVFDAFAVAHRAQASTVGLIRHAKAAYVGLLLAKELAALARCWDKPARPLVAIVGGAKVSTKFGLLSALMARVDTLIVGGGIANTLLAARGVNVGASLYEPDVLSSAQALLKQADKRGVALLLPQDVRVGKRFAADETAQQLDCNAIAADDMILDIGKRTEAQYLQAIQGAATIVWNGPVGAFELPFFAAGTAAIAQAVADSDAFSLVGGGDTIAAVAKVKDSISYISTGGGALLSYLAGETLPVLAALAAKGH